MDIRTIRKEKQNLEVEIAQAVSILATNFYKKTNSSPQSIYINMINVEMFGNPEKQFIVSSCNVTIEI